MKMSQRRSHTDDIVLLRDCSDSRCRARMFSSVSIRLRRPRTSWRIRRKVRRICDSTSIIRTSLLPGGVCKYSYSKSFRNKRHSLRIYMLITTLRHSVGSVWLKSLGLVFVLITEAGIEPTTLRLLHGHVN